jgi:hypothetical protein
MEVTFLRETIMLVRQRDFFFQNNRQCRMNVEEDIRLYGAEYISETIHRIL